MVGHEAERAARGSTERRSEWAADISPKPHRTLDGLCLSSPAHETHSQAAQDASATPFSAAC